MNPQLAAQAENPMVRLDAVLADLRQAGRPIYDLGLGDPQDPTPPFIVEALRAAVPEVSQYPRAAGTPAFRRAAAGYLHRRFGVAVDPEREVVPSAGSKEAIFHLPLMLIDRASDRRTVIYPDPGYAIYERGTAFAGGLPHPLGLSPERGHLVDLEALSPALLDRTAIFWLCSPHNPTGAVAPLAYLERLAGLAERHGFVIAADECYADLWFDAAPRSMLEVARRRVLVLHSLSKRSGMTGMRSGFVAGDPELIAALKRFRPSLGTTSPDFVLAAATAAWQDDAHVHARRDAFARKRAIFTELLGERRLSWVGEAGIYLWIRVPRPDGSSGNGRSAFTAPGDDVAFARDLAATAGIVLLPGSFLGEGGRGHVRLALSPILERCHDAAAAWRSLA